MYKDCKYADLCQSSECERCEAFASNNETDEMENNTELDNLQAPPKYILSILGTYDRGFDDSNSLYGYLLDCFHNTNPQYALAAFFVDYMEAGKVLDVGEFSVKVC